MRYRQLLRSLLNGDVLLRLAAVVLAVIILGRALLSGSSGWWAVVVVVAAAVTLWGVLWIVGRVRDLMSRPATEAPATGLASFLAGRSRSRQVAVLALLVLIVHAAITGYVGVSTIAVAIVLAVVATMLTADIKLVALLGGIAAFFALATVFVADIFSGSSEARALGISVAAIVLPIVISDKLVGLVKQPALTTTHHAVLAVLTLVLSFLGWTRAQWLPGVLNNCYTLPTSTGVTTLRATADGRCYGLLDTADAGVFATSAFGRDPVTTALQRRILDSNRSLNRGDLTVVWLGALSCEPLKTDPARCADGRDYPSERDQLRAFLYAQSHLEATTDHRVHVVIADAGQDVAHADDVASMIIHRRPALGDRLVVIGGGDSRDITQRAINRLLDAGIPVIAPNLLADLGAPDHPFVDRPGYLQLAPPNYAYAEDAVRRLAQAYPKGFRLDVYQQPSPTDQYTTSLVNDLLGAVRQQPPATARHLTSIDRIDDSICESDKGRPPAVLYFADRWTRFAEFVQRVNEVCGHSRPRLVIADVSVSRFMANYQLRAVSTADWAVNYNVSGPGCADLTAEAYRTLAHEIEKQGDLVRLKGPFACADRAPGAVNGLLRDACPLDAAAKLTSQPCRANDLGTYLIPAWDAVRLADALLPAEPAGENQLTSLNLPKFVLSTGDVATVEAGKLRDPAIDVRMWHGNPLNDPSTIWELPTPALRLPGDPAPGSPSSNGD
ncbi:hypothetical protein [Actinoplanes regularis]|uniref:ABC-type branched-chain amino acid transport system, substrate-binding protein n=1 Tax=Actinoplanes regularis TaxID=52697 RepID=A0A239IIA9_9ACTN|nr:hypothetical protein [Actinoplanes regularis]GIE91531.1 hypothetical protein Are01nite_80110 [Actinoplanes regularis]SNS93259.1 hypothetical protein SAMN06264365_12934 [Actinoplanes regularis]